MVFYITLNIYVMIQNDEKLDALNTEFDNISGIEGLCCVLGLNFPETSTPYQKAFLTLAHLMASCRDYVLKGIEVPAVVNTQVKLLADIVYDGKDAQR